MIFEHYLLLILAILPFIYKYSFWFYVIQLKEYRCDRFREYLSTKQGNSAIINMWSVIELPLFFLSLFIFINSPFEIIIYNVLLFFLLIQNIFVIRKIIKGKLIKPKFTGRLLITLLLLIIGLILDLSYIIYNEIGNVIYSYILFIYLFTPLIIFFVILLTLPFINYFKNKKINKAIKKSDKYDKPIKIGITGSYGKSSVKEYLSSILEQDGNTLKTPENINTELGVSAVILHKLKNSYKYFIAEMGAYKIGEIDILGKIVNHKYGFLTAIGNQHVALFGSQENIKKGKSEIANSVLKNGGILYINWNDKFIRNTIFDKKLNIVKYGNFEGSDAFFNILSSKEAIIQFEYTYKKHKTIFETTLLGKHNIINLTGVISCCYDLGLKTTEIKKYLKNIKAPKNTLNVINKKKYTLIDDSYNLSEDGLYAGIDVMLSFEGNKILVMDDILELGKQSNKIHYTIGKYIATRGNIENIIFCGINYKESFIKGLLDGGFNKNNILNNLDNIKEGSIILFEGRNTGKYLDKLI